MRFFILLLLATPLSAQQVVVVPDIQNTVNVEPTPIEIPVEAATPDSAAVARDEAAQRAMDAIADYLAECDCLNQGTSAVVRVGQGALVLAAFWIAYQLKRIADKDDVHNVDVDVDNNVDVNVPPHDHGRNDDDDHGES